MMIPSEGRMEFNPTSLRIDEIDILDTLMDSFQDALLLVDTTDRKIIACNIAAQRMFGYPKEQLIGQSTEILHVDKGHFDKFGAESQDALTNTGVFNGHFRMQSRDGKVFDTYHRVVLATDIHGRTMAISFIWDAYSPTHVDHPEWLARIVGPGVRQAANLVGALCVLVESICRAYGWPYGEIWIPRNDESVEFAAAWHAPSRKLAEFAEANRGMTFAPGRGLVGRVAQSGRIEWIEDVTRVSKHDFERTVTAHRAGVRSVIGFPIGSADTRLAVIVLGDLRSRRPDPATEESIRSFVTLLEPEILKHSMAVNDAQQVDPSTGLVSAAGKSPGFFSNSMPMVIFNSRDLTILDSNYAAREDIGTIQRNIAERRFTDVIGLDAQDIYDIACQIDEGAEVALLPGSRWRRQDHTNPILFRQVVWNGIAAICAAYLAEPPADSDSFSRIKNAEALVTRRLRKLTLRQQEILSHLLQHRSNKEIGRRLSLSHRTVATHRAAILQKFDARAVHEVAQQISQIFLPSGDSAQA